jgi:hypothetical protein
MKNLKIIFAICIAILLFGCDNHSNKVNVAINLESIKKFDSICKQNYTYTIGLDVHIDSNEIVLCQINDGKVKTLYLNGDGSFYGHVYLSDEEIGVNRINDYDDKVAQKVFNDFKKIIEQTIAIDKRMKRVDKILCQDFLNKDQISTLKANLFCRKNLRPTNFFEETYFGISVIIDERADQGAFKYNNNVILMDHTLTSDLCFYKDFDSEKECCISSSLCKKDGKEFQTCSISESDLEFFEKEVKIFKNMITEKIGKLKDPKLY